MATTSGVGYFYGNAEIDNAVLAGLLEDGYDYPQAYVDTFLFGPESVIAQLPATLFDLHVSSMSEMPFDPLHWDLDGNYIP
jgi:hypothetical protein